MTQSQQFEKVQYGAEASAYGTETASYTELSRVQSIDIRSENGLIVDRGLGEGLNANNTYYGPFSCSGNTVFEVNDFTFLKHWVGNRTGTGTSGDKYTLTEATSIQAAAAGAGIIQPFSVERVNDTESTKNVEFALGCVGTDYTLSGSINSKLTCAANFIGRTSGYRATGETYTPVTTAAFIMINGTWKWGATPSSLAGVQSFTINCNNGLVQNTRSIESRFLTIPLLGQRVYTFTVSIIMATALATTIINNFYGKSAGGVYTPEDGSTSTSPTASLQFQINLINSSRYATIDIDESTINRISKPSARDGGLSVLTFEGFAQKGTSNAPIKWWTV